MTDEMARIGVAIWVDGGTRQSQKQDYVGVAFPEQACICPALA